jgi:hypothetical protein
VPRLAIVWKANGYFDAASRGLHQIRICIRGANVSVEMLEQLRERMLPMLRLVAEEYRPRVPEGYPILVDSVANGVIGIEIEPSYALYITSDGKDLFADYYMRSSRIDARSSASREKFSGSPLYDRRPFSPYTTDIQLRNMIAELMARHNYQPGLIHISDS